MASTVVCFVMLYPKIMCGPRSRLLPRYVDLKMISRGDGRYIKVSVGGEQGEVYCQGAESSYGALQ